MQQTIETLERDIDSACEQVDSLYKRGQLAAAEELARWIESKQRTLRRLLEEQEAA